MLTFQRNQINELTNRRKPAYSFALLLPKRRYVTSRLGAGVDEEISKGGGHPATGGWAVWAAMAWESCRPQGHNSIRLLVLPAAQLAQWRMGGAVHGQQRYRAFVAIDGDELAIMQLLGGATDGHDGGYAIFAGDYGSV